MLSQSRERLDGLLVVTREHPGIPDAQVAGGYHRDHTEGEIIGSGIWMRCYARAGTDPVASRSGEALGAVGLIAASTPLIGIDGEIGESSERHLIAHGDLHLPLLHLAGAHDSRVDTGRIGYEIRIPGSVNQIAWTIAADGATSRLNHVPMSTPNRVASGFLGEITVAYSPWNRWMIVGQSAAASHAIRDDGSLGTVASVAVALAVGW